LTIGWRLAVAIIGLMQDPSSGTPRSATVAVLFCDLVASTARQSRLGDDAADAFRRAFFVALRDAVAATRGREVRSTGDGLKVVFPDSAVDAVTCAVLMHQRVDALDADDPARIRIGVSAGELVEEDDDWHGTPVVEAARLCALAAPGATLVTDVVRALVGSRGGHRFRPRGKLVLKGIPEPMPAWELEPESALARVSPPTVLAGRHRRRWLVPIGVALTLAVVAVVLLTRDEESERAASGVPAAVGYTPRFASRPCPTGMPALRGRSCGTLTVPEDRANPRNGREVRLLVVRAPARGAKTADPIVDFGVDVVPNSALREHADEIVLSQRGVAPSEPALTCPEYAGVAPDAFERAVRDPQTVSEGTQALSDCRARLEGSGVDIGAYDLVAMGQDMVDLLRVLHLQRVHLVSGFVLSIAAIEVAHTAPDAVATMTLQDPVLPGDGPATDPTAYLAAAFDRYAELCERDPSCATLGNLRTAYARYAEEVHSDPFVATGDDGNGHVRNVLIDRDRLAHALAGALLDRSSYPLLAVGLTQAGSDVLRGLTAGRAIEYHAEMLDPEFPWGAFLSLRCSYEPHTIAPGHALSSQSLPAFAGVDDGLLEWQCRAWNVPKLPASAFDDERSVDVPTLIVQGGLAPTVSAEWPAQLREDTFTRAIVITFATLSANPLSDGAPPCLSQLRQRFITNPTAPLNTSACASRTPIIDFVTP
jgi:class 3 adenylate cyclase/pimeloyl-ACP methyl ester carboxylesterase